jgi:hypothetical protein
MINPSDLSITYKTWIKDKGCYQVKGTVNMANHPRMEFGGVLISIEKQPPINDPADNTPALILRKLVDNPENLYVYELRSYFQQPKLYIVGETILGISDFFYFSNLSDLIYIKIYNGNPDHHPDILEITPQP